jgi:hypothetical protein
LGLPKKSREATNSTSVPLDSRTASKQQGVGDAAYLPGGCPVLDVAASHRHAVSVVLGFSAVRGVTMNASQRMRRGFHRFGLLLAATLLAIGLPLMVADAVRLKLWDAGQGDIPVLVIGVLIALVGLGLACLAVYGVVRAIGWVIGDFAA